MKIRKKPVSLKDKKDEVISRYLNGESGWKLAKEYNVTEHTVYNLLEKNKIPRRSSAFTPGASSWSSLSEQQKKDRKLAASKRMSTDNPMFKEESREKKHKTVRYLRPETGGHLSTYVRHKVIRDSQKCEECGIDYPLVVHHKDKNEFNNNINNLVALCCNCHYKVHHGMTKEEGHPWLR